jgi:hypothetical protein
MIERAAGQFLLAACFGLRSEHGRSQKPVESSSRPDSRCGADEIVQRGVNLPVIMRIKNLLLRPGD